MREYASHFLDNCFVFDGQSFEKRKKKGKKKRQSIFHSIRNSNKQNWIRVDCENFIRFVF